MTTGQNYVGGDSHATGLEQTGSTIDSTVQNGTQVVNDGAIAAPFTPTPQPKPKGDLSAAFDVSVNARYGISASDVMIFALSEYQTSRLKQATQEMASGDWSNAAESLSDSETATGMITEIALGLSKLADKNFWASQGETPNGKNYDRHSDFKTYARHYFGWSPEYIDEYVQSNL